MVVRVKSHFDILNRISKLLIVSITIVIICYMFKEYVPKDPYNFVDLQIRYKHYIVSDKFQESETDYVFRLVNPITDQEYKVYVTDYLYMNVYFVGDTIK